MKNFLLILSICFLSTSVSFGQHQDIDSSEDEVKVKKGVVAWADSVFFEHSEYKFDHFKAFYTEEYFIAVMRARMYKERADDLQKDKEAGRYKKSDEEFEKEHKQMEEAAIKIQKEVDEFVFRVTHYQVHFWSNIKTNDGITVYYEHIVKLDNNYQVTDAEIHSAIGKKSEQTQILYKKDVKGSQKKK
jgi:hypothetical protein